MSVTYGWHSYGTRQISNTTVTQSQTVFYGYEMLVILVGILLLMQNITGFDQREFILELPKRKLPCGEGLRGEMDEYLITGYIGPEFIDFVNAGWNSLVAVQVLPVGARQFSDICEIPFANTSFEMNLLCLNYNWTHECYCDHYNTTTDVIYYVVSSIARVNHSRGTIRGVWRGHGKPDFFSAKNMTLPQIHDINSAVLKLRINGNIVGEQNGICYFNLTACSLNTIELCCMSSAGRCFPRITFNKVAVAEGKSPCVNYTFTSENEGFFGVNVTQSYSLCTTNNYTTRSSCLMKTETAAVAVLSMSVNGNPAETINGSCDISLTANAANTLELCCSNTSIVCYPRIVLNGVTVTNKSSPCVIYKIAPENLQNAPVITLSYTLCTWKEYTFMNTCAVLTVLKRQKEFDGQPWKSVILIVILSLIITFFNLTFIGIYIQKHLCVNDP